MQPRPSMNQPLPTDYTRREVLQGGATAGAAALTSNSWLAAPAAEAATPKSGGTFRVRGWDPRGFDTHLELTYRTQTTTSFIYSRLFRYKAGPDVPIGQLELEGDLVESWTQPDDVTYMFKLHEGVRWHDKPPVNGRELVADDVKYTLDRFLTIPGNSRRQNLAMIDKVETIDKYTIKVALKQPYVWFLDQLAHPMSAAIIPRESVEKFGDLKTPEAAIGTGPWVLEKYDANVQATFVRHPNYFRKGLPYVDQIEWIIITDSSTSQAAYRAGKFDFGWGFVTSIGYDEYAQLKEQHPDWIYKPFLWDVVSRITFRLDRKDLPFHDVRVRRAISLAIDRQGMLDALNEGKGKMSPAVPPALVEWSLPIDQLGPGAEWYEYNPSKAKQLLAQAGYPKGFKTTMEFTTQYGTGHTEGAQLRVDMLKEVGIDVTLVPKDYGYYIKNTFRGDYAEMGYGLMGAGLEPEVYIKHLYDPESSSNSSHVNDPKMTELFHKQRVTKDIEQRREIFAEIQRYAADQVYYAYDSAAERLASWQPHVKNYNTNLGFDYGGRMLEAWIDKG